MLINVFKPGNLTDPEWMHLKINWLGKRLYMSAVLPQSLCAFVLFDRLSTTMYIYYFARIMTKSTISAVFWSANFLALWRPQWHRKREHCSTATMSMVVIFTAYFLCTIVILFTGSLHQKKENQNIFCRPEVNNLPFLKSASNWDMHVWLTMSIERHCSVFFPFNWCCKSWCTLSESTV